MNSKLTVWYNTKCPVCNAGINWQQSRLVRAARSGAIEFRDINLEPDALSRFGAGVNDVRRRLHGVDAEGRFYAGIDCAIAIWQRTPETAGSGGWSARRASPDCGLWLRSVRRSAVRVEPVEAALVALIRLRAAQGRCVPTKEPAPSDDVYLWAARRPAAPCWCLGPGLRLVVSAGQTAG